MIFADAPRGEPVVCDSSGSISDYWGRAFLIPPGSNGSVLPRLASTHPRRPTSGPSPRPGFKTVTWEGWQLRVPPLDLQRAVSQRRGLITRVALIDAILNH